MADTPLSENFYIRNPRVIQNKPAVRAVARCVLRNLAPETFPSLVFDAQSRELEKSENKYRNGIFAVTSNAQMLPSYLCACSMVLCDPLDCGATGSNVQGVSQAKML